LQQCREQLRNAEAQAVQLKEQYESTHTNWIVLDTNQQLRQQVGEATTNIATLTQEKEALARDKTELASMLLDLYDTVDTSQELAGKLRMKLEGLAERGITISKKGS